MYYFTFFPHQINKEREIKLCQIMLSMNLRPQLNTVYMHDMHNIITYNKAGHIHIVNANIVSYYLQICKIRDPECKHLHKA